MATRRNGGVPLGTRETVAERLTRLPEAGGALEVIDPESVHDNPLPANVDRREDLPDDRGWWGFSFRDVPERVSRATFRLTLPEARVAFYRDAEKDDDYYPAVITDDGRGLDLREVRFRPRHAEVLRQTPVDMDDVTWVAERVYDNHSHWLTAHLPKLLLIQERGGLDQVLLPSQRSTAMDEALNLVGIDASSLSPLNGARPVRVKRLTLYDTDRFRPELVRRVPAALGLASAGKGERRVFISRLGAKRRRLVNEDAVWPIFEAAGFERVRMEALTMQEQADLMRQTGVLAGPHGAGLTNMMLCPPGCDIIEIADLSFPNPNFYALASALGHRYWLVRANSAGDLKAHPLERDMQVDERPVRDVLDRLAEVL